MLTGSSFSSGLGGEDGLGEDGLGEDGPGGEDAPGGEDGLGGEDGFDFAVGLRVLKN